MAEVHLDFMFMGDEGDDRTLAVLLVKERSRGMVMSTVAPRWSIGQWLGRRVMAFMREAGCEVEVVISFLFSYLLAALHQLLDVVDNKPAHFR